MITCIAILMLSLLVTKNSFNAQGKVLETCDLKLERWREFYCGQQVVDSIDQIPKFDDFDDQSTIIVSYVDESILNYAQYSLSITNLYAKLHQYHHLILTPSVIVPGMPSRPSGDLNSDAEDVRWVKVWIMLNLLNDSMYRHVRHFIWMDSDIIILDLFHEFIATDGKNFLGDQDNRAEHYDLILSSEHHAETGIANTGFFIVKNSNFSRLFFHLWYHYIDHNVGHDQIGFDLLYKRFNDIWKLFIVKELQNDKGKLLHGDMPQLMEHVKILPTNAMNSIPPAFSTIRSSDAVLHLMGEDAGYRSLVFNHASRCICNRLQQFLSANRGADMSSVICNTSLNTPDATAFLRAVVNQSQYCENDFCGAGVKQYGLSRSKMSSMMVEYTFGVINSQLFPATKKSFYLLQNSDNESAANSNFREILHYISKTRELLLSQGKALWNLMDGNGSPSARIKRLSCWRLDVLHHISNLLEQVVDGDTDYLLFKISTQNSMEAFNLAALMLNDFIQEVEVYSKIIATNLDLSCSNSFMDSVGSKERITLDCYRRIEYYLRKVLDMVHPQQKHLILEMLGMNYLNNAMYLFAERQMQCNNSDKRNNDHVTGTCNVSSWLSLYELSIETYESIPNDKGNLFQLTMVHHHTAQSLCQCMDSIDFDEEKKLLVRLMRYHFDQGIVSLAALLHAEQQIKEDHYKLAMMISAALDCQTSFISRYDANANWTNWIMIWNRLAGYFYWDEDFMDFLKQNQPNLLQGKYKLMDKNITNLGSSKFFRKKKRLRV